MHTCVSYGARMASTQEARHTTPQHINMSAQFAKQEAVTGCTADTAMYAKSKTLPPILHPVCFPTAGQRLGEAPEQGGQDDARKEAAGARARPHGQLPPVKGNGCQGGEEAGQEAPCDEGAHNDDTSPSPLSRKLQLVANSSPHAN